MAHRVEFLPQAADEFAALDKAVAQRILKKLKWLDRNFDTLTPQPLGRGLKGLYKLRVGELRVLYSFDCERQVIIIHLVGHRREIYKAS